MGRLGTMLLLVVSLFLMAESLHTALNSQEVTATSNWLGSVASYEQRGFESSAGQICDGALGECNDETEEEFMMDSEAHGRLLRRVRYYISYGALAANRVPCRPRSGRSYYTRNCYAATGPVRPYHRSCTAITRCKRYTS
uniref:Rapid alkalinization factor-like protein n=1 Tax=Picea sitchensis TaxID=3332 RepID=A9NTU3_PICSI|nr:unknown [Picea sitchensis]